MILVTAPSLPFQYTPKGTPRRQFILTEYANYIAELYKRVLEESSSTAREIKPPGSWDSLDECLEFVSGVVKKSMGKGLKTTDTPPVSPY